MWVWRTIGGVFFLLGGIGMVLPGWPTTVFWIIAAICFARSDPKWADWIYRRPGVGPPIQKFVENGTLSKRTKLAALGGMTLATGIVIWALHSNRLPLSVALGLILLGAIFVISRPTPPVPPAG